jgi:hypothetical protein
MKQKNIPEPVPCPNCNSFPKQKVRIEQIERDISCVFHKLWHKCKKIDYYCSKRVNYDHFSADKELEEHCKNEAKILVVKKWNEFANKWRKKHDFKEEEA